MTDDRMELLRQRWEERLNSAVEQLAGPLNPLLEPFGLTQAQRIEEKARDIELDLLRATIAAEEGPPKVRRKNPLWAWRKRMRGK